MPSSQQREVAKQLCIFVLKYSVVLSTFAIVTFCILALMSREIYSVLDYIIEIGSLWYIAILCSSFYLSFCSLHRWLLTYTYAANLEFNRYFWLGIDHPRIVLYIFLAIGIFLLIRVGQKMAKRSSRSKGKVSTGSSSRCYP